MRSLVPTGPTAGSSTLERDTVAWCESEGGGSLWGRTDTEPYLADNLVGTVEQVIEKTQAYLDAGCRGLILWLRDYPADETLRRFMAEVVPHALVAFVERRRHAHGCARRCHSGLPGTG